MHTCMDSNIYAHASTQTHTHTCMDSDTHAYTLKHVHTCVVSHTYTCVHVNMHTHTHICRWKQRVDIGVMCPPLNLSQHSTWQCAGNGLLGVAHRHTTFCVLSVHRCSCHIPLGLTVKSGPLSMCPSNAGVSAALCQSHCHTTFHVSCQHVGVRVPPCDTHIVTPLSMCPVNM